MGPFNNYVDRILPFFDPPPLCGQFFYPDRGQKQTFFDPISPHLVHVVIEWPHRCFSYYKCYCKIRIDANKTKVKSKYQFLKTQDTDNQKFLMRKKLPKDQ